MWPLTNGSRCLVGPEADLFRGGVGMMVDQLVDELNGTPDEAIDQCDSPYPHWFSMWEPEQRVWLLDRVTASVLTSRAAPPMSAIFDATIEAVYCEISDQIAMEVIEGSPIDATSWRQSLLDAYVVRCPRDTILEAMRIETDTMAFSGSDPDGSTGIIAGDADIFDSVRRNRGEKAKGHDWLAWWTTITDRLLDATFGTRLLHDAEQYRDGDPATLRKFFISKGVNRHYIARIPPLVNRGKTQAAIDRLQGLVFDPE